LFDETSLQAVCFSSAITPLTRRLLVYFHSGAYNPEASNRYHPRAVAIGCYDISFCGLPLLVVLNA